ncbi:MAG: hypothetical protein Q8O00_06675 [Holophaga sp.]|nr:hypothetical protein [Holophaga sp.]
MALIAMSGVGCYRASGIQRPDAVAVEIPSVGGDRTQGLKAEAAPGDYYLGNDLMELAIDGTPFGQRGAVAGAVSGGSIIDASLVELDQNYKRVSPPMDMLERLSPVLNQDPSISLVFDQYKPVNTESRCRIEMTGYVHDPAHKLAGATWDSLGRVQGLAVSHSVSLEKQGRFFLLETKVVNNSNVTLPVQNIGDFLFQKTAGFRFNVPATEDMAGALLTNWGVEIPAAGPGTVFGLPFQAVKAGMVAFMGVEPSGSTEDIHSTLGILPMDSDSLVVTSDPQQAFNQTRPLAPQRLIAGSLPVASLAPGASLGHIRRLYVVGGSSVASSLPNQATGIFNQMAVDRMTLQATEFGAFSFQPSGTAVRQGPWPAEFRIERKMNATDWKLERLEWMEPFANTPGQGSTAAGPIVAMNLPVGTYRMVIQNGQPNPFNKTVMETLVNSSSTESPNLATPFAIKAKTWLTSNDSANYLCPERSNVLSTAGSPYSYRALPHYFISRRTDGTPTSVQPIRITLFGKDAAPDPSTKRVLSLGATYSAVERGITTLWMDSMGITQAPNTGVFGFQAGNQVFAASLPSSSPAAFWLGSGEYHAFGTRGPLAPLESQSISAFNGQGAIYHVFTFLPSTLPTGWTSFDLPGASLATTGGILPVEKLASALAEGVEVVGLTETDRLTNAAAIAKDFRAEFLSYLLTDDDRTPIGSAPIVMGARSANLPATAAHSAFGSATALFTPTPRQERAGGARNSSDWTLADFLAQAEGQFNIVHRPRGPQGLFVAQSFNRTVPLGQGANAWWSATGSLANGKTHGAFDALELLRAEYSDANGQALSLLNGANATAWFTEFLAVREDWFALLKQQSPTNFTKALGLSAAKFSLDTPVGLARTYLKSTGFTQDDSSPILQALQSGAAVASTGPLLDVTITPGTGTTAYGPGSLVPGPAASWKLSIKLWASAWVPVDEVRVVVNGVATVIPFNATYFTQDLTDVRLWTLTDAASQVLNLSGLVGKDAWVVVEAGVALGQTGVYRAGSEWSRLMRGIYPIAVTNPIFVKANAPGSSYTPPGL